MKKELVILLVLISLPIFILAEEKTSEMVPKLTDAETKDAPIIVNSEVYPFWGVVCTNYTYYAVYKDEKGREPEYMRIWLNGKWHDMLLLKGDPKTGATYVYNYVPDSGSSNFYYFEASNGVGKARGSIIDSPDNGPVLFSEKLDNNEIVLLDKNGEEIWSYTIGVDWVEGVAISKDGNYIAAVTNFYIYLFSKNSNKPLWKFCKECEIPSSLISGTAAGVAVSANGNYIAADLQGILYFFNKESNKPLWTRNIESGSIGIDMSDDGGVITVGAGNRIFLFDKEGNKLGEYKASHPEYGPIQTGEFYQPDVTPDGKYVSISTGCPDRRAYLFSGDGSLLFRTEMLTEDSPVHKSAISDDGSLIAYSADNMQGREIVFLFNNKGDKLWGFSSTAGTARAVSISGDGNYVAAGTAAGYLYLFSKNNNKPLWTFSESGRFVQFGDVKLNQDGSLLAAGGTTKKIYLFSKNSNKPLWEYKATTWVTKIDFNGEYIVAGTGPREYFFEGESVGPDKIQCKEIIQPEPFEKYLSKMGGGDIEGEGMEKSSQISKGICGNNLCESPQENHENCPRDCCPPTGCIGDLDEEEDDKDSDDKEITCVEFDYNEKECLAHSEDCVWVSDDRLCEDLDKTGKKETEEKEGILQIIVNFFKRLFG